MHKTDKDCDDLIMSTAKALNEEALKLLVLSTIRNSLKQRIEVAIKEWVISTSKYRKGWQEERVIIPHAQGR